MPNLEKYSDPVTIICNRCGEVLYEGEDIKYCKHVSKEEVENFIIWQRKVLKKEKK